MKRDVATVEAYLADLDADERAIVERVREAIRDIAPEIEEGLQYGMLDYPGLANLGAQKRYVALYVAPAVLAEHKAGFAGVSAGKSCLRFKKLEHADPAKLRALLRDVMAYRETATDAAH